MLVFIARRSLFSSCSEWAPFSSCIRGLLIVVASPVAAYRQRVAASVLWHMASVIAAPRLQSTGSVVGAPRLQLLCSTWDSFQTRDEPVSPALAGRFFTIEPPGKAWDFPVLGLKLPHLGRTCSSKQTGMAGLLTEYTILKELYTRVATGSKLGKEHEGLLKSYTLRTSPLGNT